MHKILEKTEGLLKSRANTISKTIDIKDWINNKDRNIFIQDLKNQDVELFIKVKKAKGVTRINTFTIIYLNE